MGSQNSREFQNSETEELGKPEKLKVSSKIKRIFAKKNLTTIVLIGALTTTGVGLGFSLGKYFSLKKTYDNLKQEHSQLAGENSQLKQEQEQLNQEQAKTIEELTQNYNLLLQEKQQLKQQNQELTNENKQAKQQYEQLNQQFTELNKKSSEIGEEYNKLKREANTLTDVVHTLTKENEALKKQLEQIKVSGLEKLTEPDELLKYNSEYGFPNYKSGLLNNQFNWDSNDILDNKGWQVVKKKSPPEVWAPYEGNVLCFKPESDFNDFSCEDNYATFHLHTDEHIESFMMGGEYHIQKNGFLDIFVSGDNKNWIHFQHFDSRGRDNYVGGGFSSYYPSRLGLKLDKNLYIRYSVGASSNKDYLVEIWRVSFHITTE